MFRPELAETLGVGRFTREIRTAANLNHPHILAVLDSGTADGLIYYVMPYAEGESLRARVSREGGLPVGDVIRILREVADALAAAHDAGVVHRDIKPDNVLLSGRHAMVADFGVAKAISESTGRNTITTVGVALGTPAYMAPEQAAADPHVDHRADIYALGVMAYEMLTGEPPFVRRTPQEVLAAHVTEPAPLVSMRRQSVPPALDALVARCLAKQPADRYQSADDIVAELERIATPSAGVSPAAGLPPTGTMPAMGTVRRHGLRTGMVLGAVLAAAGLTWLMTRGKSSSDGIDPNAVAVFPFEVSGPAELEYLREGMVNVLEASLTGEGGPRAVASQTMIAQWKRRGGAAQGLTEDEARSLARELGAGEILRGGVVASGPDLVISATLAPTGGGTPMQAQVKGPADSIASLAAKLAGQLLSLRVGEMSDRLSLLASVPPEALRRYLVGTQALRDSRFAEAYEAFASAIALDSTFALAGMGLATAQSWSLVSLGAGDGIGLAFRHRDKLAPRDLVLLEMRTPSRFAGRPLTLREALDTQERLVKQIPDRPEAWYLIGDNYVHRGTVLGLPIDEVMRRAQYAFSQVLALDPGVTYVKAHLAQIPSLLGDWDGAIRVADSLHVDVPEVYLGARAASGDTAAARIGGVLDTLNRDELMMVSYFASGTALGDSAGNMALLRSTDAAQRRNLHSVLMSLHLSQGRPKEAQREVLEIRQLSRRTPPLFPEAVYDAVFSNGDSAFGASAAAEMARRLRPMDEATRKPEFDETEPSFVAGLWAAFVNDPVGLAASIRRLDAIASRKDSTALAADARAASVALRITSGTSGSERNLLSELDSLALEGVEPGGVDARTALSLVAARGWERLGDPVRAAAAAARTAVAEPDGVLAFSAGLRDRGRLFLAVGDTAQALVAWRWYLRIRAHAEAPQRRADEEINRKVAELERLKR